MKENLRDNMTDIEVLLTDIWETTTRYLAKKQKPDGIRENIKVAKMGGKIANITRKEIESRTGEKVITDKNNLNYKYLVDNEKIKINE